MGTAPRRRLSWNRGTWFGEEERPVPCSGRWSGEVYAPVSGRSFAIRISVCEGRVIGFTWCCRERAAGLCIRSYGRRSTVLKCGKYRTLLSRDASVADLIGDISNVRVLPTPSLTGLSFHLLFERMRIFQCNVTDIFGARGARGFSKPGTSVLEGTFRTSYRKGVCVHKWSELRRSTVK
jgi:hypothetical protein